MHSPYLLIRDTSILRRGVLWSVDVHKCNLVDSCISSSQHVHLSHTQRASTCEENERSALFDP